MSDRFLIGLVVFLTLGDGASVGASPAPLVVTHRLADERAAAQHLPGTPIAAIGDTTRYVLAAPVAANIPLAGLAKAGPDGAVTLDLQCPGILAGREAILSLAMTVPPATGTTRTRCPAPPGTVQVTVHGAPPSMPVVVTANAVGLPERLETDWLSPPPGSRLRVALGLVGAQAGEKSAPVRFRVLARAKDEQPSVEVFARSVDAASPADRGWLDVEVPLDPARRLARFRLVFDTEVTGASAGFPSWGDPLVLEPAPPARTPPWNVLLVSIDTLRGDRLSCYGNRRTTTPVIDKLAAAGALFPVTLGTAPWTLPSHVSMMTGLYPCAHELVQPDLGHPLSPAARPLATVLRPAGYTTAAFTEDAFLEPSIFQRGFGIYRADAGTTGNDRVERTVGGAREWLRAYAGTPFFLFVHTYQVHAPLRVPAKYQQVFTTWEGPDGPRPLSEGPPGTQELTTYDTVLHYIDDVLGTLVTLLDELDVAGRTIVVVTSDHGEAFWEHGLAGHSKTLYEEEVRVPFVVRAPGLVEPGRRVPGLASVVDLTPTVLDLLGIEAPAPIQGHSLAPLIRAGTPAPDKPAEGVVFIENAVKGAQLAVRGVQWKGLFEDEAPARIFRLDTDPDEQHAEGSGPLVETALAARRRFEDECARTRDALAAAARRLPAAAPATPDPAHQQRLRALGYL